MSVSRFVNTTEAWGNQKRIEEPVESSYVIRETKKLLTASAFISFTAVLVYEMNAIPCDDLSTLF